MQVTNDIFTKEDGEFLVKHGALPEERIRAVETGGCPHAAIREDISINLGPLEELSNLYKADLLLCESGGGIFLVESHTGKFITIMYICLSQPTVHLGEIQKKIVLPKSLECLENVMRTCLILDDALLILSSISCCFFGIMLVDRLEDPSFLALPFCFHVNKPAITH